MISDSKQHLLLTIGTFILVISLISFTVISLAPRGDNTETTAPSKEGLQSFKVTEATPTAPVPKDGGVETKSGNVKNDDINKTGGIVSEETAVLTTEESASVTESDSTDEDEVTPPPPPPPLSTPVKVSKFELKDLCVLHSTVEDYNCFSFVLSGFPDGKVVKILYGAHSSSNFAANVQESIENGKEFKIEEHFKDLKAEPAKDGVEVSHTACANDVARKLRAMVFSKFYETVAESYPNGFFVILKGSSEELARYNLDSKLPIIPKLEVNEYPRVEKWSWFTGSYRYYGCCDIEGFGDGKVRRIFKSVIKKHGDDFEQICQVFKYIEPYEFDHVLVEKFGPMYTPAKDDKGNAFAYSNYEFIKEYTPEKIKSKGFVNFFKSLRKDKIEGKKLRSKDFFAVLTADKGTIEEYKIDDKPIK